MAQTVYNCTQSALLFCRGEHAASGSVIKGKDVGAVNDLCVELGCYLKAQPIFGMSPRSLEWPYSVLR